MNNNHIFQHDRVIIFGRYPIPGKAKKRLIPVLGQAGAADLQRRLMERTLATVRAIASWRGTGVEIRLEGGNEEKVRRWIGSDTILSQQGPRDLGQRMHAAFLEAFQVGCNRVVLVDADTPTLTTDHLREAFDTLTVHDLVLGPRIDGGFWLIGLRQPLDGFLDIKWSAGRVVEQTVALARRQGIEFHLLDRLRGIDTGEDLKKWRPEEARSRPYISVIIPVFNEAARIKATINEARKKDVEIIVVDGGSSDDTVIRATATGARVESSPLGRSVQQNRGASAARGSVLLFLPADTRLPSSYVNHVFETLMDPSTALGAFRFKTDIHGPLMKVIEFITNIRSRYLKLPYREQCLFVRKPIFESVGGFPDVSIAEDIFLARLLSKQGSINIVPAYAVTRASRWTTHGLLRTILVDQVITAGCYLGVSPHTLGSLSRSPRKK